MSDQKHIPDPLPIRPAEHKFKAAVPEHQVLDFGISPTAGGGGLGRLRSSPPSQVQVQRGEAELDLDLTRGT